MSTYLDYQVLAYMSASTASFFAQKYYFDRELREYKAMETKLTWGVFKEFLKELAALFTMRMGKQSADEFVTDYLMTTGESRFNLESTLPEMPTTMNDWVKYTQRFDNQWRELQNIKSSVPTTMPHHNNPFCYDSSNAPTSMNNSVVPMAIDAICTLLTDDEQAKLRAEGGHMANQCPARVSSRIHEGGIGHVQLSSGKVEYCPAQAGRALASRRGGYGRAILARAQISGETATLGESRSMATTNPFRARLTACQAYASKEDASVRQKKSEVSQEEVQSLIGKMRWDEQEALLQELSKGSKQKESDMDF
ncbi:hypothetical protein HETIRDRAFT_418735 [Heterobasidion irregulare TC 32-1]|uniref:Uncharacterized protein n=1 Tax=Heterobasidion irregulare (strain TC 32-1) TaxID=747525 RepID=W4K4P2_HETIT|nr:uncharacterized protein HETIRDRAFT_418735 [Heterobasidion irregulare TC 32-1]ETW80773.1 hypothetical protein HETIRDRAFT_418735 [Heterobasidion irregulare TC 32-1]